MGDPLVDYLRSCCLHILGQRPGCGFFIAPRLVVTCSHVVGRDVEIGAEVKLDQWKKGTIKPLDGATVLANFPEDDIAFIQTVESNLTFAPLSGHVRMGHKLTALGFPDGGNRQILDQFTAVYEGQTLFIDSQGRAGAEAKFKTGQVEPGFSGGPLLNLKTFRVMGVVVATRDSRNNLGGWAIEVSVVERLLRECQQELPSLDSSWTDAEARQQEGLSPEMIQLNPEQLRQLMQNPERERVEQLSQSLGKNQNAIRLALRSLGESEQQISDETLPLKLIESIQSFENQLKSLAVLRSEDPEIETQFEQARLALESDNPEVADTAFEAAAELALARARAAEDLEVKAREVRERGLSEAAEAFAQRGQLAMARLSYLDAADHFAQAAETLPSSQSSQSFDYRLLQAAALYRYGDEQGDNPILLRVIKVYTDLLNICSRELNPSSWAMTQNNLGYALRTMGERESGTKRLKEAVQAFREALQEYTRERVPLAWAMTQNNLGTALSTLGERESGTERLEEAVQAHRAALQERTRERVPLDWAMTQNNLGNTLSRLGERESGTERLKEAVKAFREALQEYTCERVPLAWAMTQNNLGTALSRLGERESGTERLEEAVKAFREALQERTRERVPLAWAMTQNNLGNTLQTMGSRELGTERLKEAVQAYREALQEYTRERVPLDWAVTQNNLGNAFQALGTRESGTERLEESVQAYRAALQERTRERVPLDWAMTQNNLGAALQTMGSRELGTERLEEAVQAFREALQERTRERVPLDWAMTQNNLGTALSRLGERESGTERLEEAVEAFHEALQERTRERVPLDWATTQNNLGTALWTLGERNKDRIPLELAKVTIQNAYNVYRNAGYEQHNEYFEQRLIDIDRIIDSL
jgi:tetratricopeptide (TPR) repeat protein